jgi:hypothetical protein
MSRAFTPLYTPDGEERRQREQIADAIVRRPLLDPAIRTTSFVAAVDAVYRVAGVGGSVPKVVLPVPSAVLFGKTVTVFLEGGAAEIWVAGVSTALGALSVVGLYEARCSIAGWRVHALLDGSVTNDILADMPANTVKANATGAAAPPQDFSLNNNEILGRAGGSITAIGITTQAVLGRQGANVTDIDASASTWLGRDGGGDLDFYPPVGGGRASLTTPAAITNSASSIVGPTLTIPADTLAAGQVWRAVSWYRFSRGATATALDINARLRVTSDLVQAWVVSQTAAGEYQGRVEIVFAVATTGAPGTSYGSVWLDHALGRLVGTPGTQAAHNAGCNVETATIAIDTTISNTFQLRMAMTAAVASTTLTITHGVIERVF